MALLMLMSSGWWQSVQLDGTIPKCDDSQALEFLKYNSQLLQKCYTSLIHTLQVPEYGETVGTLGPV